jgi:hypothetical protein
MHGCELPKDGSQRWVVRLTPPESFEKRLGDEGSVSERIWTLEEAVAFLPRLRAMVQPLLADAPELAKRFEQLKEARKRAARGAATDAELSALEQSFHDALDAYDQGFQAIAELGVSVKDPKIGLFDFYGRVDGRTVWLCWLYGEDTIRYYHELDAGFAGRKPLDCATKSRLLN